jgi:hypothetical protein
MKTAVEFLLEELFELNNPTLNQIEIIKKAKEIIKQAKKMEKKQLCNFYIEGGKAEINNPYVTNIEFYNKTFNKNY